MKTHTRFTIITLIAVMLFAILATGCATHKGYNYKKHHAKSVHFKARNEAGRYMKCNRR